MAKRKPRKSSRKKPARKPVGRYQLIAPDGRPVKVPAKMQKALARVAAAIEKGEDVTVLKLEEELTTQQAADILNVSRQYVVRLVDEGKLPATKTGTHRRLQRTDVLSFKKQRDRVREEALAEIARIGQEQSVGGYYDDWTPSEKSK